MFIQWCSQEFYTGGETLAVCPNNPFLSLTVLESNKLCKILTSSTDHWFLFSANWLRSRFKYEFYSTIWELKGGEHFIITIPSALRISKVPSVQMLQNREKEGFQSLKLSFWLRHCVHLLLLNDLETKNDKKKKFYKIWS